MSAAEPFGGDFLGWLEGVAAWDWQAGGPGRIEDVDVPETPARWTAWAASVYAFEVRQQLSPPPEVRDSYTEWDASTQTHRRPLLEHWIRMAKLRRKAVAGALCLLANERLSWIDEQTPDQSDPWYGIARRWAETYRRLPGPEFLDTPRHASLLADLRREERLSRVAERKKD